VITWHQLGLHRKPIGVLNINHYYDSLEGMIAVATAEGFIREKNRGIVIFDTDPARLLEKMAAYDGPQCEVRLDESST
jgi:predicted Rossmann-fold nucleotide-binding protein